MHIGKLGTATETDPPRDTPAHGAILAVWFIEITDRNAPCFFRHHVITVIHLRPIEGVSDVQRHDPDAEYQLMAYSLDPEGLMNVRPEADNPRYWRVLRPLDVELQFKGVDDKGAKSLCARVAQLCVDGVIPVEPARVQFADTIWKKAIATELKAIAAGAEKKEQVM